MVPYRIVERPTVVVAGPSEWISGQDNEQFRHFRPECRTDGTFSKFEPLTGVPPALSPTINMGDP